MKLFDIRNKKVEEVEQLSFKLERDIQNLIEPNVETFFGLKFVKSEFTVDKYRVDTLCFNEETNSFVIIEYKKGNSYSVIDQGYTYLQLLLNHKSDFLLVLSQYFNKVMRFEEVDWSQSRIVFVSPSFNSYQKDSVNFKDLPFELWEIKNYSNNTVVLNQHRSNSKESIETLNPNTSNSMITQVTKEVTVYTVEQHLSKTTQKVVEKWNQINERLSSLDEIEIIPKSPYISVMYYGKTVCYFNFMKKGIRIDILRGNINPDGSKSKNYFDIDDPKGISTEGSWEWKSGTMGTLYRIYFDENSDIDYTMFLINQKYNQLLKG
jgi:RecB family endonuclease NucS